ncbi:TetR/AcrR family transcriptional regulator [Actinoplanes sp. NBRC 103695]|uniref:TetR/AcrR family transcriptional regulator n=1 Tax=Actinoplanes sp. NBRC 103695 TaxID=3032202 RepID=UPI0024A0C694|nr:TetR/AcrR family transcriptional regulator [Actinoplanes sp. NBRC 103695]GLZ00643.1 TetR family transcriptional regulator [Actinoplanes sp. NBRC 103695]
MVRWQPDARDRLERAAIELFQEQGFAATTVPEITARAGLTTRTFHRHFADKREVLFGAVEEMPELATRMIIDAPAAQEPMTVILEGLRMVAVTRFEGRRDDLRLRREIVRSDAGLRERNLHKWSTLSEAIRAGFIARGLPATRAALLAETAVTLLHVSFDEWLDRDDDSSLFQIIENTRDLLREAIA